MFPFGWRGFRKQPNIKPTKSMKLNPMQNKMKVIKMWHQEHTVKHELRTIKKNRQNTVAERFANTCHDKKKRGQLKQNVVHSSRNDLCCVNCSVEQKYTKSLTLNILMACFITLTNPSRVTFIVRRQQNWLFCRHDLSLLPEVKVPSH